MAMRRTNSFASFPTVAAALLGALLSAGCGGEEEALEIKGETKEEELGPPVKVSLPPPPNFDEGKAPEQWEDGAWSIWGLRRDIDKHVAEGDSGTEIEVKGWVQEIYVPPPCPEGGCPLPKKPHVWITDQDGVEGKKRAMMVVDYAFVIPEWQAKDWKAEPNVILEKGKRYTFKGLFKQFSDTGFASDHGLVEFKWYKPLDPVTGAEQPTWVAPPGAAWHPLTIQQTDEQNAKMAEAAAKTAIKQPKPK
jgi:hypothetical protein